MLYPLKFAPILKDKIWGGTKLKTLFGKPATSDHLGESWELSGYEGDESVVTNGFLAGNNLAELLEVYMGDLVGDRVFERYGHTFPLLFKLIDANDNLSIQVHPNDETARTRHNSLGKTEMWYVVDADPGAELIIGFAPRRAGARHRPGRGGGRDTGVERHHLPHLRLQTQGCRRPRTRTACGAGTRRD